MKKILLLLGFVAGISLSVNAQYFTTSYGLQLNWGIPSRVETVIHHDYYGYEWVHASRVSRIGFDYFDVVLRRGDIYLEVSVRNDGFIARRSAIMNYPLYEHVCAASCGYHNTFYASNHNNCNSHAHNGHNHVVYYQKNEHNHGNGHAYGKHKNGNHESKSHHEVNQRSVQKSKTYTRRDRYHNENSRGNNAGGRSKVNNSRSASGGRSR